MFNALEILMIVVAVGVMAIGMSRRWQSPAYKRSDLCSADWPAMVAKVFGQQRLLVRPVVGLAHICLVWGFVIYILIVILAQTPIKFSTPAANIISLLLDIIGLLMLASTLFLIIRRVTRIKTKRDLRPPKQTLLPMVLLFIILLSGFFSEGARLNIVSSNSLLVSPVGWIFSIVLPGSPSFMQAMLRLHFVFVMLFIVSIPFTFMRHLVSISAHLLYKDKRPDQLPKQLNLDMGPLGATTIMDLSEQQLREVEACVSCGRCDEQCPALLSGKPLSPSSIMGKIIDQKEIIPRLSSEKYKHGSQRLGDTISEDEIWSCTTCMACVTNCPAYINPMDKIIEMRRGLVLQEGCLPSEAIPIIRNLELYGDVNGKGLSHRADWALNRNVPHLSESSNGHEVMLWVGCSGAFHPEYQETTRDLVKLLQTGGVDFGILAYEEFCCGEPARKLGDEALFHKLARRNMENLKKYKISKIVTLCPHCFNTLSREYPVLGFEVEVLPAVRLVEQMIQDHRISLKYPFAKSLVVHDPCYLGRYNGIYESMRHVCSSVPGVSLKELDRSRSHGFCCGGGGGRMWLHETIGENINMLRAREVVTADVDAVATACPYCLIMMEDGIKTVAEENPPQVIDIIRLAAGSIG